MKYLLLLIILPAYCFSQPLKEIKTKDDAENFIVNNYRFNKYKYDSFKIDSASTEYDNFKKGDFNHDGVPDLLIFGKAQVTVKGETYDNEDEIILLLGNKHRKAIKVNIPYSFFRGLGIHVVPTPKMIKVDNYDCLLIQYETTQLFAESTSNFADTMYVEFDNLLPYNPSPSNKKISKIEFKTDYCYGSCPVFEISMDKNYDVVYSGIDHVIKRGEYKLRAEVKDWQYLIKLIRNLNIEEFKDYYAVQYTDDQTAFLTIYFDDGSKKHIKDYGLKGSYGLSIIYDYFFDLIEF
ncbi:MAG: hypothetical protein CMO01_22230 [Thalassobius sp.]|nr:hypothetical protein [Thalassovita sp.]